MNFEQISSKNNERIKQVHRLVASSSERADMGLFVLEGLRLCRDAAQNGVIATELYFTEYALSKFHDDVELMIAKSVNAFCVTDDVFKKMNDTWVSQYSCIPLGMYFTGIFEGTKMTNIVTKYCSTSYGTGTSYGLRI